MLKRCQPGWQSAKFSWHLLLQNFIWSIPRPCPISDRHYVETSKGEWTVAKNGYRRRVRVVQRTVGLLSGRRPWWSDTGFSSVIPTGRGPSFERLRRPLRIREVEARHAQHANAAREIAAEYFDSDKVLGRLLEESLKNDT